MCAREGGGGSGVRAPRLYALTNGMLKVLVGDLNVDATRLKVIWSCPPWSSGLGWGVRQ